MTSSLTLTVISLKKSENLKDFLEHNTQEYS